jgi:hypothetical protein
MFREICPEINLDYDLIEESLKDKETVHFLTIKSRFIFNQGNYKPNNLLSLGFLYCFHFNPASRLDEFWQFVNPEIEEEV